MRQRAQRRPGAAYSLPGGGRCRGGPNDILPPKQEGAPSRSPARSNPAKAPTGSELQPHRAQSTMYPASSCPRYHLRKSTAEPELIMLLAALHLPFFEHHTITTFLHSPHDTLPYSIPRTPASLHILWHPAPLRPRHAGRVQCEARRLPGHCLLSTRSSTPRKSYTFFHA